MSSRYGRNKRRAHRERITKLESELAVASRRASLAERAIAYAKEDGANAVLRTKYLDQEIARMTVYLARSYGPELMNAAKKVLDASLERPQSPIDFRAAFDLGQDSFSVLTVEGVIPSLRYRVPVPQW